MFKIITKSNITSSVINADWKLKEVGEKCKHIHLLNVKFRLTSTNAL